MSEFTALEALTAKNPTERQWIVRAAAEFLVLNGILDRAPDAMLACKAAAICASSMLAWDASLYLAGLTPIGWCRIAVDVHIAAKWAAEKQWRF